MDSIMVDTREVIDSLRDLFADLKEKEGMSVDSAYAIIDKKDHSSAPSRTTVARVLSRTGGYNFRWETTIRPIANALLELKEEETAETDTYKSILKLKKDTIDDLEVQNEELKELLRVEKQKYHDKLEKEKAKYQKTLDFAENQIALKDKRIDQLMEENNRLINHFLDCPLRNKECAGDSK